MSEASSHRGPSSSSRQVPRVAAFQGGGGGGYPEIPASRAERIATSVCGSVGPWRTRNLRHPRRPPWMTLRVVVMRLGRQSRRWKWMRVVVAGSSMTPLRPSSGSARLCRMRTIFLMTLSASPFWGLMPMKGSCSFLSLRLARGASADRCLFAVFL